MHGLRARCKTSALDCAGYLPGRKARKAAHTGVCNALRNAAGGQKDKQDGAFILHRALSFPHETGCSRFCRRAHGAKLPATTRGVALASMLPMPVHKS
jgi:hypothetical protein